MVANAIYMKWRCAPVKKDNITSTEKLLEQIRGNKPSSASSPRPGIPVEPPSGWRDRFHSVLKFKKPIRIGVDIGYTDVRLVKTVEIATNRHQILDCRQVPFDPGLDPQNLLFPQFLRNTLASFGGSTDSASIWATISSARLDTRLLRIPKVARRQIPNAVIWAYKKKNPYNDKQRLFDFEVLGEATEGDTPQIEVLAYTIPREDIDSIKTAFSRAGYTLDGVSTYPFLLQNLLRTRWKILSQGNLCALYIGRNWSRIDLFNNGTLMLSRGIRAGMSSMIEEIKADPRIISEKSSDSALEMDFRPIPTPSELPHEASDLVPTAVLARLAPGLGSTAEEVSLDQLAGGLEPDDVFEIIRPALDRLNRQVERTIGHYAINFEHREIDRLCVSGSICESERVRNYIAEQLGIPLIDLNPFDSETLPGQPDTEQEQLSYIPAVGLASAGDSRTPNFLQTYHDRSKREKRQFFNCVLFGLFLLSMLGFLGYTGWQKHHLLAKHKQTIHLQQALEEFSPLLNPETVLILAAKAKEATGKLTQHSDKYRGVAVIAELSRMTPADILMTKIAIQLPHRNDSVEEKPRRVLAIGGIIRGERLNLEPTLAAYMVQMKASPLLTEPRIVDKSFEMLDGREVLRFTAELEII
jgi:Tfp pilus assembly PilM family ATPase